MLIEHVDAIVDMRRSLNLTTGNVPGTAPEMLANLRETETQGGNARGARYDWAIDLDVPTAEPGRPVELLLFAGEGAFDMRYQRTLRALVKILKAANVDFAVLGDGHGATVDRDRLMTAGDVDDAQARRADRHGAIDEQAAVVGASVAEGRHHPIQTGRIW